MGSRVGPFCRERRLGAICGLETFGFDLHPDYLPRRVVVEPGQAPCQQERHCGPDVLQCTNFGMQEAEMKTSVAAFAMI